MKKIELEDLKTLETYLAHAFEEIDKPYGEGTVEAKHYINDALAEIKRWKKDEKRN